MEEKLLLRYLENSREFLPEILQCVITDESPVASDHFVKKLFTHLQYLLT